MSTLASTQNQTNETGKDWMIHMKKYQFVVPVHTVGTRDNICSTVFLHSWYNPRSD